METLDYIPDGAVVTGEGPYAVLSECEGRYKLFRYTTYGEAREVWNKFSCRGCDADVCLQYHDLVRILYRLSSGSVEDQFHSVSDFELMLADATKHANTEKAIGFVRDIQQKYREHGGGLFLTGKQYDWLLKLARMS